MDSGNSSTKLRQRILHYIDSHQRRYGCTPGRQLVQNAFAEAPRASVKSCLSRYEREGLIEADAVEAASGMACIPVQGFHAPRAAGPRQTGRAGALAINLAGMGCATPPDAYAIQVPDDSMIGANLMKGDLAMLAPVPVRNGDIVAAVISGELTLRRYAVEAGIPYLKTEAPSPFDPMPAFLAPIQGVLWASLRIAPGAERFDPPEGRRVDYTKLGKSRLSLKQPVSTMKPKKRVRSTGPRAASKRKVGLYLSAANKMPLIKPGKGLADFCVNESPAAPRKRPKAKR